MPRITAQEPSIDGWIARNPCPDSGEGVHGWIMSAANICRNSGIYADRAFDIISDNITRPENPQGEISDTIAKAYNSNGSFKPSARVPVKAKFDPELLARIAGKVPFEITEDWLAEKSPEYVLDVSPSDFLAALYEPRESVIVFDEYLSQGQAVWRYGDDTNSLDQFCSGRENVWFLCNPSDAEFRLNDSGNMSRRSWQNVTAWRYGVIESDKAPADQWLRLLVQIPLPIAAIYTSGKRSIHALFRVDADTKEEWDDLVCGEGCVMEQLVRVGACPGSFTAVRLTRLPGCVRGESGQMQKLLYLNPEPKDQPIL